MRTTLDLDEGLLSRAQARFPPGTPKTVVIEEALRRLEASAPTSSHVRRDPRLERLQSEGLMVLAQQRGAAPVGPEGRLPLRQLLDDLARDREDR